MKVIKLSKGWSHRFFVSPESVCERIALTRRGYKRRPRTSMAGWHNWWASDKHITGCHEGKNLFSREIQA